MSTTDSSKETPGRAAHSTMSGYELRDSILLDSGVSVSISNNEERLKPFRAAPNDEYLYSRDSKVLVMGYGTMVAYNKHPTGRYSVRADIPYEPNIIERVASSRKCRAQLSSLYAVVIEIESKWTLPPVFARCVDDPWRVYIPRMMDPPHCLPLSELLHNR
jgi:hypothetical protein